jgi:hypothetical protein
MTGDITVFKYAFEPVGPAYRCRALNAIVHRTFENGIKRPWRAKIGDEDIKSNSGRRAKTFPTALAAARAIVSRLDPGATGKRVAKRALTDEQAALLRRLRSMSGPRWREAIRRHWSGESPFRQSDMTDNERAILQGLRNSHGPSWLLRVVIE